MNESKAATSCTMIFDVPSSPCNSKYTESNEHILYYSYAGALKADTHCRKQAQFCKDASSSSFVTVLGIWSFSK